MLAFLAPLVDGQPAYVTALRLACVRVPRGSVVKCLTRKTSGSFRGSVLGQDTSEPSLVLVKPRKA